MIDRFLAWLKGDSPVEPPAEVFTLGSLSMLIESPALEQRVPSVEALSVYIQALQAVCTEELDSTELVGGLDLTVAVWEGGRSDVWYRCTEPVRLDGLMASLRGVPAPEVRGPIGFVVRGGVRCRPDAEALPLLPEAWLAVVEQAGREAMSVHELLEALRPE